ncbi:putative G-protein coupled receptor 56-like [Scophthalmus maximus]|uniref:Putative G-protein coupled receptor 56-like n=1 Tax=Scophthalmus maximus TaxID=52904 RepID=A0A2U9BDE8_SCOMX|nr:putative G-protein coupled receptor 56-like [Scophthalmus maximus]
MWIFLIITLSWLSTARAGNLCKDVLSECYRSALCHQTAHWTRCYEERISTCVRGRSFIPNFVLQTVNSSQEAEVSPTSMHRVHIPSSALRRSRGDESQTDVVLVTTVINSTYFTPSPRRMKGTRTALTPNSSAHGQGTVMGGLVLAVRAGSRPVVNLSQPITLTFTHDKQMEKGSCVFWEELEDGAGHWSRHGCETNDTGAAVVCSCNHLSFFAVLVNPVLSVGETHSTNLSYITYIGSALSVFFTVSSLIICTCLQRRCPKKAIGVHMHLTGALLCLHLGFLLSSFWVWQLAGGKEGWVCRCLGLFLHWSMLATFCWMTLEGFHLYLLLVQVFNIYVRRYMLKLSLVGWGLPTLIAVVCAISGVYGKNSLELRDARNHNSTAQICWMSNQFPQRLVVSYITTVAFPCLVILYNSCMLGLVVFKLWSVRRGSGDWKTGNSEGGTRLWKDGVTVLGLSWVLGLPWGLAATTYISLPGIYVFTILNSLQGVFMFLWSMALTRKSQSDNSSSIRDPSSQNMTTIVNK